MTKEEFEKKMIALLGEAMQAGLLHSMVFLANTREHHMMLTNMGQKSMVRFILHMTEHAIDDSRSGKLSVYNLATGEQFEDPIASETFATGTVPKGNGRRKKAH